MTFKAAASVSLGQHIFGRASGQMPRRKRKRRKPKRRYTRRYR